MSATDSQQIVLTGITTTGTPHLGNYAGAIKPAIQAANNDACQSYFFLADYHALIKSQDAALVRRSAVEVAATWLACGLDIEKTVFYRQSDVPEIMQLNWLLSCVCSKGLLNRAHAYKAAVDINLANGDDADKSITMGLFNYPILMAADILMFNAHQVPVGKDQIQHVEMARVMAQRFNHIYGEHFNLPTAKIASDAAILSGLDGRKMSKSYNNTIELFAPSKQLRKQIMRIVTNSLAPGEAKDPATSSVYAIYKSFATVEQSAEFAAKLRDGMAWGDAKQELFLLLDEELAPSRDRYAQLMANQKRIEEALESGGKRAQQVAADFMERLLAAVGIGSFATK